LSPALERNNCERLKEMIKSGCTNSPLNEWFRRNQYRPSKARTESRVCGSDHRRWTSGL